MRLAVNSSVTVCSPVRRSSAALAPDIWINRGGDRNPAGEWCYGAEDCGIVSPSAVKATKGCYSFIGTVTYGQAVTGNAQDEPTVHQHGA